MEPFPPESTEPSNGDSPLFWPLVLVAIGAIEGWLLFKFWTAWEGASASRAAGCPDECLGDLEVAWWGFWLIVSPLAVLAAALLARRLLRLLPR